MKLKFISSFLFVLSISYSQCQQSLKQTYCGPPVSPCVASAKYRRLDGSCNNLKVSTFGAVNNTFIRLLPAKYSDGIEQVREGVNKVELPSVRLISTSLFPAGDSPSKSLNINAMQFGQIIAHDMSFLKPSNGACCTPDGKLEQLLDSSCLPIMIPSDDQTMGKAGIECMDFYRGLTDKDLQCPRDPKNPVNQINVVTAWMDLSLVYDQNEEKNRKLRTLKGGLLKTDKRDGIDYLPPSTTKEQTCICMRGEDSECYLAGDKRVNSNPTLALLQTIFMREHNRIARILSKLNPKWNDETVFQEARKINIATYQRIAYYEYLPMFLTGEYAVNNKLIFPKSRTYVNDYNNKVNPGVSDAHAQAAFRFPHTQTAGKLNLYDGERSVTSTVKLNNFWHRPQLLATSDSIKQLTMGLVTQACEESDLIHAEAIIDHTFQCDDTEFGLDLKAVDLQRDRDFGLATYNDFRKYCGLKVAQCFDDYADLIPQDKVDILKQIYDDYRDVDLSVGGSLETLVPDAQVGPTFQCIVGEQFLRTRRSDRYWFENSAAGFSKSQLNEIRKASMSRILCDNGDGINDIQPSAFHIISDSNPLTACENIPQIDLTLWKVR